MTKIDDSIGAFDRDLLAFWDALKPTLRGLVHANARSIARTELCKWIGGPYPKIGEGDWMDGRIKHLRGADDWMVVCDESNNPPNMVYEGEFEAVVWVLVNGERYRWELDHHIGKEEIGFGERDD